MTVGLVGDGPGAAAVEAALGDADGGVERVEAGDLGPDHDLAVVVDRAGSRTFQLANERALAAETPWLGVELGGIGGYPVVDAAVTAFEPDAACYECLVARVASNVQADAEPVPAPADSIARFAGAVAGQRAVAVLAPEGADRFGTVVELPYAERKLLPVPGCDCGDDRDRVLDRGYRDRSVDSALGRAEKGLDERVGVVTEVGEAESYPAPYYLAQLCDTAAFADATAARQAAGVDPGWDAAFMKALGEGYERYCAGVWRRAEFETGTAADVERAVAPSTFVRPADFSGDGENGEAAADGPTREGDGHEVGADDDDEVDDGDGDEVGDGDGDEVGDEAVDARERPWVEGEALDSGERVHLPAELVHYPPPERTIRPAVTTGLGLGNSSVEALLSGLYEVVERDAALLAWYSTFEPLGLAVEDEEYRTLAARAGAEGLDATPLLLTQDVDVPVVAVAVHRESWPAVAFGTAAHLDPGRAARNALAEAVQNWVELREMGPDADAADGAIARYADDPSGVERFTEPGQRVPAASVGPDDVPDGADHLAAVLDRVTDVGLAPYAARTTTRDVQRLGFEAVRVLVPAAQPLFFDDSYFGERARTVPGSLGFEPALDRAHHPYP